ncbi:MAG: hypothetical protein ACR2IK_17685 [Chloroflexota bacterium]
MTHERRALAALLLLLQAALALLAALGLLVYARAGNALGSLAVPETVALAGPLALVALAVGLCRGWRWATPAIVVWQALTLLGTGFSVLASAGGALNLSFGLTGLVLPGAILFLALRERADGRDLQRWLTAALLLLTGFIHIALVPEHLREAPRLGVLFALDGAAFVILALASLSLPAARLRWPTAALLIATVLAYLGMIVSRREAVEDLAVATKLIELTALALVVWPFGRRWDWRWATSVAGVLLAVTVSGAVAWAASFRSTPTGHSHDGSVVLAAAPPTDEQRAAAARLVDDTRAGIQAYTNVQVALTDGYRPSTPPLAPTVHYTNTAYQHDDRILDPTRPEALVYANTPGGPVLLGAMYMLPKANVAPPDVGGSLTEWHTHTNLCFGLPTFRIDGFQSPFGTCPIGSINAPTPAMLHIWTGANGTGSQARDVVGF